MSSSSFHCLLFRGEAVLFFLANGGKRPDDYSSRLTTPPPLPRSTSEKGRCAVAVLERKKRKVEKPKPDTCIEIERVIVDL